MRGGKLNVGDAIDRPSRCQLVIQRDGLDLSRGKLVRLTGNPGLGVGLSAQNAITDITPGGVAFLDGRIQSGDMLIVFDGVGVANGKKGLSQVVKEQKEMIEARGGSLNPWREIILKRRLQPKPPPTEDPKGGRRGSKKDLLAEEPPTKFEWKVRASSLPVDKTERDKKTNAIKGERMVPFALDKKNAIVTLHESCDELNLGDVVTMIDGKKIAGGPHEMKAASKTTKGLDAKLPIHTISLERPQVYLADGVQPLPEEKPVEPPSRRRRRRPKPAPPPAPPPAAPPSRSGSRAAAGAATRRSQAACAAASTAPATAAGGERGKHAQWLLE